MSVTSCVLMRPRLRTIIIIGVVLGALLYFAYPAIFPPKFPEAGGAAALLLRGSPYPVLRLEVDTEVDIPDEELDRVKSFVARYTDKTIIVIKETIVDLGDQRTYRLKDIVEIANTQRDWVPFSFLTASVHIMVLANPYERAGVAGITYGPTSIVIFASLIPMNLMDVTITHELGHAFGLVCASGLDPPVGSDWKCDGTGHSTDGSSLMAAHIDTSSPNVINLELTANERHQLDYIKREG